MNALRQAIIETLIFDMDATTRDIAETLDLDVEDLYYELRNMHTDGLVSATPFWSVEGAASFECECFSVFDDDELGSDWNRCIGCARWRYCGGAVSQALTVAETATA